MTSFMLSALARKFALSTPDRFRQAHPHCWIVWEPGVWKPPARDSRATLAVIRMPTPAPASGEALAMVLASKSGREGQVAVGRGAGCDIEINDATLSNVHLVLMDAGADGWTVRDAGSTNGSWLDGLPLQPGVPVVLRDGAKVQAGQVWLTFFRPEGMLRRIASTPVSKG